MGPNTTFREPTFKVKVRDETMSRGGIDAALPAPAFKGAAASIVEIKLTISRIVAVGPAFACPDLLQAPTEEGRRTQGFRDSVLNLAPNQTLAVGRRYSNQHLFGMCTEDFNKIAYLGECSEADFMADNGGKVGALSKLLAYWLRREARTCVQQPLAARRLGMALPTEQLAWSPRAPWGRCIR